MFNAIEAGVGSDYRRNNPWERSLPLNLSDGVGMALVGKLEDLNLTELFHMLSLFRKSGRLTLSANDRKGVFLFKDGKIVHAADGGPRESLGQLMLARNIVSRETLERALDLQTNDNEHRRLGTILVSLGAVTEEQVELLIRERLQAITREFLHAETGFFSFKPEEERSSKGADDPIDVDLPTGMNTDQFILDLLTRLDAVEEREGRPQMLGGSGGGPTESDVDRVESDITLSGIFSYMVDPATYGTETAEPDTDLDIARNLAELRSLMIEIQLRSPSFTGEITLMILRFATRIVNRGLLCHVTPGGITGIGQFGLARPGETTESVDRRVRAMRIPLDEPSVFIEVFETMHSYRGRLKDSWWNSQLIRFLGGPAPTEVVVIPIVVDGMIEGMFYGDNVPDNRSIGSIHALELLMIEAGLAMEKALLRSRLRQAQGRLQRLEREARS